MGWNGPMTHRQFIIWQIWLGDQINVPSRDNYYQMQIACEMRRMFSKNPENIKLDSFKLTFTQKASSEQSNDGKPLTDMEKAIITRKRWMSRMTAPVTVIQDGVEQKEKYIPPIVLQQQERAKHILANREQANRRTEHIKKGRPSRQRPNKPQTH